MKIGEHGIAYWALHAVKRGLVRVKRTVVSLASLPRYLADPAKTQTRFPEQELKPRPRIFLDNILWILRYGEINTYYFAYGFDRKRGSHPEQYMALRKGRDLIGKSNAKAWTGLRSLDYRCLCKDKFVFGAFLDDLGFPTPKIVSVYDGHQLFWLDRKIAAGLESLKEVGHLDLFCKDALGSCGNDAFALKVDAGRIFVDGRECSLDDLAKLLATPAILQERLTQHPRMAEMHPASINALRVVTVLRDGMVKPFGAFVKCGTHGRSVDNWAAGGIAIGVHLETGRLFERGTYAPGKGGSTFSHPDTGFVFDGFQVPFYEEALALTVRLHPYFYGLASIGWDIALTPAGPVFIEGNDFWDTRAIQAIIGGLKSELLQAIPGGRSPNS